MRKSASSDEFRRAVSEILKNKLRETFFEKLDLFIKELLKWNRVHNLTPSDSPEEILFQHVLDSLYFFKCAEANSIKYTGRRLIDIGSGAGFPGIVLALAEKNLKIYLLESRKKRAAFLKYVSALIELKNVQVLNERLENVKEKISEGYEDKFYIGTSRASMKPEKLLKLTADIIEQEGYLFIWSTITQAENMLDKIHQYTNWQLGLCKYDFQSSSSLKIINDFYSFDKKTIIIAKNSGGTSVDSGNC